VIFVIFKMAFQDGGRRHLGFSKIRNFNVGFAVRCHYAPSCQISSKWIKWLQRYGDLTVFQNGGRPPSWICWAHIGITHNDYVVVFVTVQNLVRIDAVDSMIRNFRYFAGLA